MAIGRAKPQKGFAQCGKNCARIASEFGAEILRSIEHAGLPEEIDAPVDLAHVVPGAQRVHRELRNRLLTGLRSGPDGHQGGVDAVGQGSTVPPSCYRCADRILRLTGAAP